MSHLERKLEEVKERQRRLEQLQDMQRMQQQQAQALLQQQQMSMMPQAQAQAQAMQQMLMLHQVQNRDNCAISSSRRHSQGDLKSSLISLGIDAIEEDELNPGVDADASFKLSNLDFSGMDMSFLSSDPVSIPSSRGGVALPPPNNDFGIDNAKKDRDEDEVDELRRTTTTTTDDKNNCGIDGGVGTFPMKSSDNDKVNHHLQGRSSIPLSVVAEQQTLRRKTTSSIIDDNFNESFKSMEMSDRSLLKNVNTASTESGVVIVGEQKQRGRLPDPDGDILLASGGREERGGRLLGTIHSSRAPSSATADGTAAASTSANNARLSSERTRQRDDPIRRRSNDSMAISDPDFGVSFTSIKSFQSSSRSNDSNSSSHWLSHYKSIDSIDDGQFDPWDEEDVVLSSHHNSHHNSSDGSMSIISAPRMVKTAGGNH
ncbi:hypothetical protein ACHAW5_009827 [Stephanodiscus triporus]|uniref:Uncharacterized protein n=1 Tax=Stephanodiscus triporus TaxID=2934178 RepID=A0ABD3PM03_9STRA